MSANLKPCPFCGSDKQMLLGPTCQKNDPYDPDTRAFPIIRCGGCYTDVPGRDWDNSGLSAAEAWNRRPAEFSLLSLRTEMEAMAAYALEVTKALTGLAGGGSEMFSGRIGNIFKADLDRCVQVVRDRHDRAHQFMVKAVKERDELRKATVAARVAIAEVLADGGVDCTKWFDGLVSAQQTMHAAYPSTRQEIEAFRNREGNGNAA